MILEAFSEVLKQRYQKPGDALPLLEGWLMGYLLDSLAPNGSQESHVQNVLTTEIEVLWVKAPPIKDKVKDKLKGNPTSKKMPMLAPAPMAIFVGKSPTGHRLLNSLTEYCKSYEDWQYRRWLHQVQPAHFNHYWHSPEETA